MARMCIPLVAAAMLAIVSTADARWEREFFGHYFSSADAGKVAGKINQGHADGWRNATYERSQNPTTKTYGVYAERYYPDDAGNPLPPVGGGRVFQGQLTKGDPFDRERQGRHAKVYSLAMTAGRTYTIDLQSGNGQRTNPPAPGFFDTYLRIEDATGREVGSNDDGGDGYNSRLDFRPSNSGTYRVIVTSYRTGATGSFTLRIAEGGAATGRVILSRTGSLTQGMAKDSARKNSFARAYNLAMQAGRTYKIDLTSGNGRRTNPPAPGFFDVYLRIEDASGNEVARNDDGGDGYNAQLEFTPRSTQTYRIVVTSFRSEAVGNYLLQVRN